MSPRVVAPVWGRGAFGTEVLWKLLALTSSRSIFSPLSCVLPLTPFPLLSHCLFRSACLFTHGEYLQTPVKLLIYQEHIISLWFPSSSWITIVRQPIAFSILPLGSCLSWLSRMPLIHILLASPQSPFTAIYLSHPFTLSLYSLFHCPWQTPAHTLSVGFHIKAWVKRFECVIKSPVHHPHPPSPVPSTRSS